MKIDRDLFIDQGYLVLRNVIPKKTVLFLLGLMILVGLACGDSTEKVNDYLSKAKLHLDNGEYQKAIDKYNKSLETDPPYTPAIIDKEIAERMLKETSGK